MLNNGLLLKSTCRVAKPVDGTSAGRGDTPLYYCTVQVLVRDRNFIKIASYDVQIATLYTGLCRDSKVAEEN